MGKLETQTKEKARRVQIRQKIALALFRMTTNSASAAFAPEEILRRRLFPKDAKGSPARRIRQALHRLEAQGMIKRQTAARGWAAVLTEEGKRFAKKLHAAESIRIRPPRVWDQKWRIVIFDIWERRRGVRDKLRRTLEKVGFRRIQDSVWVCPYDCEELVAFLRADLRLGEGILYLIAEGVENDAKLRKLFDL